MTPDEVRSARQAAGISQAELGRRLGVSAVAVHRWEKGTRTPSADTVRRIRRALEPVEFADSEMASRPLVLLSGEQALVIDARGASNATVVRIGASGAPVDAATARRLEAAAARHPQVGQFLAQSLTRHSLQEQPEPLG